MYFDLIEIFQTFEKHFEINFWNLFKESDNFLFSKIIGQTHYIGVNYVTSVSASVEAYREVEGCLSWMVI